MTPDLVYLLRQRRSFQVKQRRIEHYAKWSKRKLTEDTFGRRINKWYNNKYCIPTDINNLKEKMAEGRITSKGPKRRNNSYSQATSLKNFLKKRIAINA